jgi:hypothetical protein
VKGGTVPPKPMRPGHRGHNPPNADWLRGARHEAGACTRYKMMGFARLAMGREEGTSQGSAHRMRAIRWFPHGNRADGLRASLASLMPLGAAGATGMVSPRGHRPILMWFAARLVIGADGLLADIHTP